MKGYSLTRLARATPMDASDKPPNMNDMNDMNQKWANTSSAIADNQGSGNAPERRSMRPPETSLGGKDHTASPADTPSERFFVEDGSNAPATKVPGSNKLSISEELTRKYRPGLASDGAHDKRAGNSPRGVGVSHQWMEAKR